MRTETLSATRPARVVFMGTPGFALPTLEVLHRDHRLVAVVTQPDRPAGRGRRLSASPVKLRALALGVPVLQPQSLRKEPDVAGTLKALEPDAIVVAAYGLILPPAILDLAPGGALNVHASLLPRWRGAAPVQWAILSGDTTTGVTIMQMDAGLDTGAILAQRELSVGRRTGGQLVDDLARLGADLLADVVPRWLRGEVSPVPQDASKATYAPRIESADRRLDWRAEAAALARRVRALEPEPGAFTTFAGAVLKVHEASAMPRPGAAAATAVPGLVVETDLGPAVICGEGALLLEQVQPAGKGTMSGTDFLRGRPHFVGARLSEEVA